MKPTRIGRDYLHGITKTVVEIPKGWEPIWDRGSISCALYEDGTLTIFIRRKLSSEEKLLLKMKGKSQLEKALGINNEKESQD